jgi:hypothetical protein
MFIPDPTFFLPGSNCLHPGSRSLIKQFKYFNPKKNKKWFLSSKKYDPGCSSRIRMLTFSHPGSRGQKQCCGSGMIFSGSGSDFSQSFGSDPGSDSGSRSCMKTYTHTQISTHIHTYTHAHTQTYTNTNTHTYTHAHTHYCLYVTVI